MIIRVGNFYYFGAIFFAIALVIGLYFLLRNKSKKLAYTLLLVWCFAGFILHFLKQLNYMSFYSLRKSTAENICAVSTLIFPFIMLYKKQGAIHDFMFFIGVISGVAALIYPTEAIDKEVFCFETLRFYFCHISLFAIPLLLALLNIYRPKIKNFWKMPLFFLCYEFIICLNTGMLVLTGLYTSDKMTPLQAFLDRNILNNSFVFGPTDDTGVVGKIVGAMCPNFMKTDIFNINNGEMTYWPVIWIAIPSFVVFVPIYLLLCLPFYLVEKKRRDFGG